MACEGVGIKPIAPYAIPWRIRLVVAKLRLSLRLGWFRSKSRIIIVPCAGYPDSFTFPYGYLNEIVPVLWDTWPRYHERLVSSFKRHRVRLAFFTQRQVANLIRVRMPWVKCVWLPEAVDPAGYIKGNDLQYRSIDVLELGRLMSRFHEQIVGGKFVHRFCKPEDGLLFKDFEGLCKGLSDAKITVSFPRCDTNPEQAGDIETLTLRYWECMLSRTLMLGRCPQELIDVIGYNPVVEVDWSDVKGQIRYILSHITSYQELVDKNYSVALKNASWSGRMEGILKELNAVYG